MGMFFQENTCVGTIAQPKSHHANGDRRTNAFGLLMSLNMLIEFGDAFDYTGADFCGWCSEVGFKRFEFISLTGATSAAIAYK